jgi:glycogen debranching enzyme
VKSPPESKRTREASADEEDRYHILATSSLTLSGARVLKQGDTFAVFDRFGDVRPLGRLGAQGLYHEGTRFLSALRLLVDGERPLLLSSIVRENNVLLAVDLMNPDLQRDGQLLVPHGTLHVFRSKSLWKSACYEHIQISNFGPTRIALELRLEFAADFADVFEVRGTRRERRGTLHDAEITQNGVVLSYTGLDGERRATRLEFAPAPDQTGPSHATFRIELETKQTRDLYLTAVCEIGDARPDHPPPFETAYAEACNALATIEREACSIYTANEQFNDWLNRCVADLHMMITETPAGLYPYAGVPWFSTPFGRDGIWSSLEALWLNPGIARGVLRFLAAAQADSVDTLADAEPGKIIHEMRSGEMARLREIPFGRYYGSVDSTPLFVVLAAEYFEGTADLDTIVTIWPNIERALDWIDRYGDRDGDGFVEYGRSKEGLVHQGWKDSHDSVFHADGTPAEGPIALCEVQGYVYAAKLGAALLASVLGKRDLETRLRSQAEELRARFDQAFWCEDIGSYALALDGAKRACRVRTSNAGHCLWSGIALSERAPIQAAQLLSSEMFSGWGVRTLASNEQRYNPMSYHNGSIWPHDNAIVAAGLARYGMKDQAARVLGALFDASLFVDLHRLPELFCGFARRPGEGPTLYPVACSPQAWAAAAPFMLLKSVLGFVVEASDARVRFDHPALPQFLGEVKINKLKVGSSFVDLVLHLYPEDVGINVAGRRGKVEVVAVK